METVLITCLPVSAMDVHQLGPRRRPDSEPVQALAWTMLPPVAEKTALPTMWTCPQKSTRMPLKSTQRHLKTFHHHSPTHTRQLGKPNLHQEQPRHLQSCPTHCTVRPRSVLSGYAVELGTTPENKDPAQRVPAAIMEAHGLSITWAYDMAACSNSFSACRHSACLSHTPAWLNDSV